MLCNESKQEQVQQNFEHKCVVFVWSTYLSLWCGHVLLEFLLQLAPSFICSTFFSNICRITTWSFIKISLSGCSRDNQDWPIIRTIDGCTILQTDKEAMTRVSGNRSQVAYPDEKDDSISFNKSCWISEKVVTMSSEKNDGGYVNK